MGSGAVTRILAAAGCAAVLGGGLAAAAVHRSPAVSADTVLTGVGTATRATVVPARGSARQVRRGARLMVGDTVEVTAGTVVLATEGRLTTLGPAAIATLLGPSTYWLSAGSLVLDERQGPPATVAAGPVVVTAIGRPSLRVDRGYSVQVGVFSGGGARVAAADRTIDVDALHQVQVPGTSLPSASSPLTLSDDALDLAGDPSLVAADRALDARAMALDQPSGAAVADVLLDRMPGRPTSGMPPSERVLPLAIAETAPEATYSTVAGLRAAGGSWGVVAALTGASVTSVQRVLTGSGRDVPVTSNALGDDALGDNALADTGSDDPASADPAGGTADVASSEMGSVLSLLGSSRGAP